MLVLAFQTRIQKGKIERRDSDIQRLSFNVSQLMSEKQRETTLFLKEKELTGTLSHQKDSLAKALKIRPKQIEKIVERVNIIHDTVRVLVEVERTGINSWHLVDQGKCYTWQGDVYLYNDSLTVWKSDFASRNKQMDVFWKERPKKFLFIRFGKLTNYHQSSTDCGEMTIKTFEFVK